MRRKLSKFEGLKCILIIRNKKSGQSMHALTKTKVSEASLTNLHNSQLLRKCYVVATR